ncbi:MAG: SGNH/GDSL hydrolase family protein [Candidatus Omnitrophica bacterium]|nr:SGNH/GDSL hydrolase family protein [Candidatus Omnitrophota bacterium]
MVNKQHPLKIVIFSFIPLILLVTCLELGARTYFALKYKTGRYLSYGFDVRHQGAGNNGPSEKIVMYDRVKHEIIKMPDGTKYCKSKPGVYNQRYGSREFKVAVNSLGFRGKEFSAEKPDGVYRIFCLGGSSTEGLEVEDGNDYPSILEKKLNAIDLPVRAEVMNAGYMGSTSKTILSLFTNEILRYRPDLITFYEAFNDYHRVDDLSPVTRHFAAVPHLFNLLYSKSLLFSIIIEKNCIFKKKVYSKELIAKIMREFSKNLRELVAKAREHGIGIILAKQGTVIKGYDMYFDPKQVEAIRVKVNAGQPVTREDIYYYLHALTRNAIDEIARDMSVKTVDIHTELLKHPSEEVYYDIVHLTEKGNEVIASGLVDAVKEEISKELRLKS